MNKLKKRQRLKQILVIKKTLELGNNMFKAINSLPDNQLKQLMVEQIKSSYFARMAEITRIPAKILKSHGLRIDKRRQRRFVYKGKRPALVFPNINPVGVLKIGNEIIGTIDGVNYVRGEIEE